MAGSNKDDSKISLADSGRPLWLVSELSYRCPLQCSYCSNPVDFSRHKGELSTEQWLDVFKQARDLGTVQLGFSGGEPAVRKDLEELIQEARQMGFYTNLITSMVGVNEARLGKILDAGIDHIQVSFQAANASLNDLIAGTECFEHKVKMCKAIKEAGLPMVLNVVIHKGNIDNIEQIIQFAEQLDADYLELATAQYYGFALLNRDRLLPSREQLEKAEKIAKQYQDSLAGKMKIFYIIPDYYEKKPKPCMHGWGKVFLTVAPDGTALPCHSARELPGIDFPNVVGNDLNEIWYQSKAFNHFRGDHWMKETCRNCPEKDNDFGGCRCQAYLLAQDVEEADPACEKSPHHHIIEKAIASSESKPFGEGLIYRNSANSKIFLKQS